MIIQLSILKDLNTMSRFDLAVELLFEKTIHEDKPPLQWNNFYLSHWTKKTDGDLSDQDRQLLAQIYCNAKSVFEYVVSTSTYIAA